MLIVGLTGSFGTGKTTVSKMFAARGAKVIDADKIAHGLISARGACGKKIIKAFGKGVLTGGKIDRSKLARIVFDEPKKLKILEGIIHPQVLKKIKDQLGALKRAKRFKVVIVEVPLLFESGLHRIVDRVVVVTANRDVQIARLRKRTRMDRADILKRIKSQLPLSQKVYWADHVIANSGAVSQTQKQVRIIWDKFKNVGK